MKKTITAALRCSATALAYMGMAQPAAAFPPNGACVQSEMRAILTGIPSGNPEAFPWQISVGEDISNGNNGWNFDATYPVVNITEYVCKNPDGSFQITDAGPTSATQQAGNYEMIAQAYVGDGTCPSEWDSGFSPNAILPYEESVAPPCNPPPPPPPPSGGSPGGGTGGTGGGGCNPAQTANGCK